MATLDELREEMRAGLEGRAKPKASLMVGGHRFGDIVGVDLAVSEDVAVATTLTVKPEEDPKVVEALRAGFEKMSGDGERIEIGSLGDFGSTAKYAAAAERASEGFTVSGWLPTAPRTFTEPLSAEEVKAIYAAKGRDRISGTTADKIIIDDPIDSSIGAAFRAKEMSARPLPEPSTSTGPRTYVSRAETRWRRRTRG